MQNQGQSFATGEQTAVNEAINGILDSALGNSGNQSGLPDVEGKRPPEIDPLETDRKNEELRVKKHIEERDRARAELSQRDAMIAHLQGQLEVLTKFSKPEASNEPDPTENMTQTESALYNGIKQLEAQLKALHGNVDGIQNKVVKKEYEAKEGKFYGDYGLDSPEKKEEAKDLVKGFVSGEPEIMKRLLNGEIEVGRVYELALLKSGKSIINNTTQDPTAIFGKGRPEANATGNGGVNQDTLEKSKAILRDKNSTGKAQAVSAGISSIVDDLLNQMSS